MSFELIKELFTEEISAFTVKRFSYYVGRRDKQLVKNIFDPFMKGLDKEMKLLKGKWNGKDGYEFKKQEQAVEAQKVMDELTEAWKELLKKYPENSQSLDALVADQYFKHAKKSGNPNAK